ncbi:hypothetical protein RN001_009050 [Aquatica leii]|uniref:Uncharacterized protein n=1 Tax=Aquatica leii TaxID=1421715 RepID=A0AAN7PTC8_9COLE|nr:hypothetical protein RN001_009050 [Aquatica leii]
MMKYVILLVALFAVSMAEPEPEAKPQYLAAYPYALGYNNYLGYAMDSQPSTSRHRHVPLTEEQLRFYAENSNDDEEFLMEMCSDSKDDDQVEEKDGENGEILAVEYEELNTSDEKTVDDDLRSYMVAKSGLKWSTTPMKTSRRRLANILANKPRLTQYSTNISTIESAFILFFTAEMIDIIATETNQKANLMHEEWNKKHP